MEMLLEWGLTPQTYDSLPWEVRTEMHLFWRGKVLRDRILHERHRADMEDKAAQARARRGR